VADNDPVGGGVASCGSGPVEGSSAFDEEDSPSKKKKKSWIAIKLVDEDGKPVPGEEYCIILPDGSPMEGDLDKRGFAKVKGIDPGTCQITFPNLDKSTWHKK
jgi:hypothetical protein